MALGVQAKASTQREWFCVAVEYRLIVILVSRCSKKESSQGSCPQGSYHRDNCQRASLVVKGPFMYIRDTSDSVSPCLTPSALYYLIIYSFSGLAVHAAGLVIQFICEGSCSEFYILPELGTRFKQWYGYRTVYFHG